MYEFEQCQVIPEKIANMSSEAPLAESQLTTAYTQMLQSFASCNYKV